MELPIFPLRTVLFPDGFLPLRIFEQRYLKMVRDCASNDSDFGVCLILEGEEAIAPVKPALVGTVAEIVDWYTLEDGLLGVSAIGADRFRVTHTQRLANGLMMGQVELLPEPPTQVVPEEYSVLTQVLARFMDKVGDKYPAFSPDKLDDANWVGYRLAELLPLATIEKQQLLELNDPLKRLGELLHILPRFQSE